MRHKVDTNPALAHVLHDTEREMAISDRYDDSFGYVFYLKRKTS